MNNIKIFFGVIILLIIGTIVTVFMRSNADSSLVISGKYDTFATCLKTKALFLWRFWCPHCQSQKKLFGSSVKLLPYVECSTADGARQLQICKDKM